MPTVVRKIVSIDEDLCNGCGLCVTPCAEAAIEIVDGKAKVIKEELCDGAGFCLAVCPTGALSIEEREAEAFDHHAVEERASQVAERLIATREAAEAGDDLAAAQAKAAEIHCERCGATEYQNALLAARIQGRSVWVCTRCLPALIHG